MTKIKICGIKRSEDNEYVTKYLPDYIGFVFAKSKRQVSIQVSEKLKKSLCDKIKAVGVFVNEDIDIIKSICDKKIIDIIQLHGTEDEEYILSVKKITNLPIIKAVSVKDRLDIEKSRNLPVDFLLLDNKVAGSGQTFDHNLIPKDMKDYFLAGGIDIDNVKDILKLKPYSIDISSGVETNGVKDENKIKRIIEIIRSDFN